MVDVAVAIVVSHVVDTVATIREVTIFVFVYVYGFTSYFVSIHVLYTIFLAPI